MLFFRGREPGTHIPRGEPERDPDRLSRGWRIDQIQEARFETHFNADGPSICLLSIKRI